nr:hypothetical protein Iba_chr07dCG4060 [Ipomoea batatas]GMD18943.1 hypothetical protein Iba_chr07eCG4060 [Ipomoea batatas]
MCFFFLHSHVLASIGVAEGYVDDSRGCAMNIPLGRTKYWASVCDIACSADNSQGCVMNISSGHTKYLGLVCDIAIKPFFEFMTLKTFYVIGCSSVCTSMSGFSLHRPSSQRRNQTPPRPSKPFGDLNFTRQRRQQWRNKWK